MKKPKVSQSIWAAIVGLIGLVIAQATGIPVPVVGSVLEPVSDAVKCHVTLCPEEEAQIEADKQAQAEAFERAREEAKAKREAAGK
jgi:hypothetical protein